MTHCRRSRFVCRYQDYGLSCWLLLRASPKQHPCQNFVSRKFKFIWQVWLHSGYQMQSCNPANPSTIFVVENCVRKDTTCPLNIYLSCTSWQWLVQASRKYIDWKGFGFKLVCRAKTYKGFCAKCFWRMECLVFLSLAWSSGI